MVELSKFLVTPENTLREVMACIDGNKKGIALVVDKKRHLIGTVTDGDARRAILRGMALDAPIDKIMNRDPLSAPPGLSAKELLRVMDEDKKETDVNQLPVVDEQGRVVDLVTRFALSGSSRLPISAVIMAGGYGMRLRPLTDETPKPMLEVGGRPAIEWIIKGLREAGIHHIIITTCYKADAIMQHFSDGSSFGVKIEYIYEEQLSGTAGPLGSIPPWKQPLLVVNGDILTRVDFRAMLNYHQEHKADMTVAVREYHLKIPYGIVEMEDVNLRGLSEKPSLRLFMNAGIYLLEPILQSYITKGEFLDMTALIESLLDKRRSVVGFPVREYWIDIGREVDYGQAQEDLKSGRFKPGKE